MVEESVFVLAVSEGWLKMKAPCASWRVLVHRTEEERYESEVHFSWVPASFLGDMAVAIFMFLSAQPLCAQFRYRLHSGTVTDASGARQWRQSNNLNKRRYECGRFTTHRPGFGSL